MKNPVITVDGQFQVIDPSYIFIKSGKRIKVIKANTIRVGEKIVYCDRCRTVPAYQLDCQYAEGYHDFTLCQFCLEELGIPMKGENE